MKSDYIIEIFYTNIFFSNGGVEKLIKSQIQGFKTNGVSSILLFPIKSTNKIGTYWGVKVDDNEILINSNKKLLMQLKKIILRGDTIKAIFIHHMLGVSLECVQKLVDYIAPAPVYVYLHDFYTACAQINLLKNDREYCGGVGLNEYKCFECKYYTKSKYNFNIIYDFLEKNNCERLHIIAPSIFVKKEWIKLYKTFADKIEIQEHQKYIGSFTNNCELVKNNGQMKIAYIGRPVRQKGWESWRNFLLNGNLNGYDIYQLGSFSENDDLDKITNINISFQRDGENAMIDALRKNKIHIAILNSISPETYSYVYNECLAANVFIITNRRSGNIAAQVEYNGNGYVLDEVDDLCDFLSDANNVRKMLNNFRKKEHMVPEILKLNDSIIHCVCEMKIKHIPEYPYPKHRCLDILGNILTIIYKKYRFKIEGYSSKK